MSLDILPESRAIHAKGAVQRGEVWWVPLFCANCGKPQGLVPESSTHAFWLCDPCGDKWAPIAGYYTEPDAVYYQKLEEFQMEKYGRILTTEEVLAELDIYDSALSRLVRERQRLTPRSS